MIYITVQQTSAILFRAPKLRSGTAYKINTIGIGSYTALLACCFVMKRHFTGNYTLKKMQMQQYYELNIMIGKKGNERKKANLQVTHFIKTYFFAGCRLTEWLCFFNTRTLKKKIFFFYYIIISECFKTRLHESSRRSRDDFCRGRNSSPYLVIFVFLF